MVRIAPTPLEQRAPQVRALSTGACRGRQREPAVDDRIARRGGRARARGGGEAVPDQALVLEHFWRGIQPRLALDERSNGVDGTAGREQRFAADTIDLREHGDRQLLRQRREPGQSVLGVAGFRVDLRAQDLDEAALIRIGCGLCLAKARRRAGNVVARELDAGRGQQVAGALAAGSAGRELAIELVRGPEVAALLGGLGAPDSRPRRLRRFAHALQRRARGDETEADGERDELKIPDQRPVHWSHSMDRMYSENEDPATSGPETRGVLYVVGTPIGNLGDLSPRAREVLGRVDFVAAEDTRRTRRLLSNIGVQAELMSYHEHNESRRTAALLELLAAGRRVALVSDAGMPLVSDPGWTLVRRALEAGIAVRPVPGPCAVTAALCVSGLPTDRFAFEGFLPRRAAARAARLEALANEPRTLVFFEAVHRVRDTLAALVEHFGADRPASLARELTKVHEQVYAGTLGAVHDAVGADVPELGEFVLVVGGREAAPGGDADEVLRVYGVLGKTLAPDQAVALTAELTGHSRNEVYRLTRVR